MTTPPYGANASEMLENSSREPRSAASSTLGVRLADVAALRADGSIVIGQRKVPTMPLFDSAFSALARGTPLQTEHGPVAIEDLQPGDRVLTAGGTPSQIVWIGSATFAPSDARDGQLLTRLMADSFGVNRPDSFLSLGPAARVLQTPPDRRAEPGERRIMTPASAFVDGVNAINVVPQTPVQMFHLCLEEHAAVIAGGLEIETFHPGPNPGRLLSHTLKSVLLSVFPHLTHLNEFGPLNYERVTDDADLDAA
ncbi:Hint domain-containing protein [Roseobacter sp. A03A-229]